MYNTNQEQLQEIEHLSKQVEMLRSVNDQHAKVYEQLDATARDLEQRNRRLSLENRSAQLNIEGLTETINVLQGQVEELQREIENLTPDLQEPSSINQSDKNPPSEHSECASTPSLEEDDWEEEEHKALLHSLQAQLNLERNLRETAEQEAEALAREIGELEPRASLLEGYKTRLAEVEAEVEELRQLTRSGSALRMLPGALFFPSEEEVGEMWETKQVQKCCNTERQVLEAGTKDEDMRNEEHTDGRLEIVKSHGMSLLNEVDDQYNALQRKYNALLRRCEDGSRSQCDKAVQTSTTKQSVPDCTQLPEYKTLFNEIFTNIQNSKKDLEMNRTKLNVVSPSQDC
ncbi:cerebellar degeneration-related protein 2 isoform X2 [Hemibagrus wyckioides]|nr:cerebellar degeneration-related protein 2 isoform X2 [Hemibagrus wyckioides]XP_058261609.1 cerebellar degeneration-related protein 2 isoform X2 [Hemibagrus wyckioides]